MTPFAAAPTTTTVLAARQLTLARIRTLKQITLLVSVLNIGFNQVANAYIGGALLSWAASTVIAPIGLIAICIAIGGAIFNPMLVSKALYTALICAGLFCVITNADTILTDLQAQ